MSHLNRSLSKQRNGGSSRSITPSKRNKSHKDEIFSQMRSARNELTVGNDDDADGDDYEEEELDPRVQEELEHLNTRTDEINQLENELEEANCSFRTLLTDSTHQLKALSKKISVSTIEKARPYYEALDISNRAQKECQAAATAYQRAHGIHAAAKETIALAEQRFLSNSKEWEFDNAWQEMLNHATIKVMAAEKQKTESEAEHLKRAAMFTAAEQDVQRLEKKLQRNIQKSAPYFEQKEAFNKALELQKKRVQDLQAKVSLAKSQYSNSLRKLEEISESIHARRKLRQLWNPVTGPTAAREPGVGAELDFDLDVCDVGSTRSTTSGQSATKWDSSLELDDSCDSCADLASKFQSLGATATSSPRAVTRTTSCPAHMFNPQKQHSRNMSTSSSVFEQSSSSCGDESLSKSDSFDDPSVVGFQLGGAQIDL